MEKMVGEEMSSGFGKEVYDDLCNFYSSKKVLITGHTGFKGSWLTRMLIDMGADVTGFSLPPKSDNDLFSICKLEGLCKTVYGDIRDYDKLSKTFAEAQPGIVFHLAAQPLVLHGYNEPVYTFETNVMGTVHLLDCIRNSEHVQSVVNVTTDKVYQNFERTTGYLESDVLNGFDPYANSKSCSELVTDCYRNSFLQSTGVKVSTARAGNVIGGGDVAQNRILPDCIRAAVKAENITIRNINSIRPYQHVLEPLFAYMLLAYRQFDDTKFEGAYNIGPDSADCITTGKLVEIFCEAWGGDQGWTQLQSGGLHESTFLMLDCSKFKATFDWKPVWNVASAVAKTVEFEKEVLDGAEPNTIMQRQIQGYIEKKSDKLQCLGF